jgi:hypothetical protein
MTSLKLNGFSNTSALLMMMVVGDLALLFPGDAPKIIFSRPINGDSNRRETMKAKNTEIAMWPQNR